MKQLHFILFWVMSFWLYAQAPHGIPYQAVVRNADGTVMSNAAINITFKIHDNSATGTVVYEETHATTTNAQGLVSLNVGGGTAVTGTFSGIQWGAGSKFLHVLMNAGNGVVDLGTQQMMSVPYALYAEEVNVRVSATGDSLFIGDQVSIVPGVSAANLQPLYTMGNGVNDIDGNYYPSIIINGQEWMQKNLSVTKYNNGDSILSRLNNNAGSLIEYPEGTINKVLYGKLYNGFAVNDSRGLCPAGWHVPNDNDWFQLLYFLNHEPLGFFDSYSWYFNPPISTVGFDCAGDLKTVSNWIEPNASASNTSGFSAVPGGYYINSVGIYENTPSGYFSIGASACFWSSTNQDNMWNSARNIYSYSSYIIVDDIADSCCVGHSVRCIKD